MDLIAILLSDIFAFLLSYQNTRGLWSTLVSNSWIKLLEDVPYSFAIWTLLSFWGHLQLNLNKMIFLYVVWIEICMFLVQFKEYRIENQIWSFITMEKKLVQSILLLYTGFFFHVQVTKVYSITRKRVMNNI